MICKCLHIDIKKNYLQKILTMPINSRNKGASYERQIVGILNEFFSKKNLKINCKRNLDQYQTANLPDITIPFHAVECKHYKEGNWYKPDWWRQVCESAALDESIPVLVFKFNRVPTRVCIPLHAINTNWPKDNDKVAVMSMEGWLEILDKNWDYYRTLYGSTQ